MPSVDVVLCVAVSMALLRQAYQTGYLETLLDMDYGDIYFEISLRYIENQTLIQWCVLIFASRVMVPSILVKAERMGWIPARSPGPPKTAAEPEPDGKKGADGKASEKAAKTKKPEAKTNKKKAEQKVD